MKPRHLPVLIVLLLVLIAPSGVTLAAERRSNKPLNVVFILVDDLGWRDLSNEGSTFYETPHVDSIARRGMKFTRGYAACSVCSPSRASLLTGTYPTRHGITSYIGDLWGEAARRRRPASHLPPKYADHLDHEQITLAEAFKGAGYKTFFAGKWHLGGEGSLPTDHGFEINKGGGRGGGPSGGRFFSPYKNAALEDGPAGESLTLRLGRETADFIKASADQPFFAMLSFYAVHAPVQTTADRWKKYRDRAERMGLTRNNQRFIFDRRLPVRQVQDHPIYAGMVETMDEAVGLVLTQLKELGLEDNTIICFTSDNGGVSSGDAFATSNLPLRGGKGRQWEGGVREPYTSSRPAEPSPAQPVPYPSMAWTGIRRCWTWRASRCRPTNRWTASVSRPCWLESPSPTVRCSGTSPTTATRAANHRPPSFVIRGS
jgi:arylsulfatase A-like enzyme